MSIQVQDICKRYGAQEAVSHVTFEIPAGKVVGLLGANGAGKSTIMKILAGFIPPTSGEPLINGVNVRQQPIETKRLVGYLPEHNPLYQDMYITEYLRFVYDIYGLPRAGAARQVRSVMEQTGLMPERSKKIGQLSKGYRQRVGLAQALVHNPQALILDEPTSGLDPNQLAEIRTLIAEVGKEKTVMLSTHIMQEVEALCSSVIIINKGRMVAYDTPQNVRRTAANAAVAPIEVMLAVPVADGQWRAADFVADVRVLQSGAAMLYAHGNEDIRPQIFNFVVQKGWTLIEMKQHEKPLEEVFRQLTVNNNT
jgi:ABC-2 type transport system ATP-binding protein